MRKLDVRKGDLVLLYDTDMMFGVSRAAWMFAVFGIPTQVLDGPIKIWIDLGLPLHGEQTKPMPARALPEADDFKFRV